MIGDAVPGPPAFFAFHQQHGSRARRHRPGDNDAHATGLPRRSGCLPAEPPAFAGAGSILRSSVSRVPAMPIGDKGQSCCTSQGARQERGEAIYGRTISKPSRWRVSHAIGPKRQMPGVWGQSPQDGHREPDVPKGARLMHTLSRFALSTSSNALSLSESTSSTATSAPPDAITGTTISERVEPEQAMYPGN
jgi:hypothetical protein